MPRKGYKITDEIEIIKETLAELLPENADVQAWNSVVENAKLKYLKV